MLTVQLTICHSVDPLGFRAFDLIVGDKTRSNTEVKFDSIRDTFASLPVNFIQLNSSRFASHCAAGVKRIREICQLISNGCQVGEMRRNIYLPAAQSEQRKALHPTDAFYKLFATRAKGNCSVAKPKEIAYSIWEMKQWGAD